MGLSTLIFISLVVRHLPQDRLKSHMHEYLFHELVHSTDRLLAFFSLVKVGFMKYFYTWLLMGFLLMKEHLGFTIVSCELTAMYM